MTQTKRIHNHEQNYNTTLKTLEASEISKKNKELLLTFLDEYGTDKNLSYARKLKYVSNFRKAVEILEADFDKLTTEQVRSFVNKLRALDCSERTKEDYWVLLKTFYKWYSHSKYFPKSQNETGNYIRDFLFRPDKNKLRQKPILTEEEVLKMISHATSVRDKCLLAVLWESGARIEEILTLRNVDIQLWNITDKRTGYKINITISKTAKRNLPLIDSVPFLDDYINFLGSYYQDKNKPFFVELHNKIQRTNTGDRRMGYHAVRIMIKRVAERAEINKDITAHIFRHSRATYLANKNWSEARSSNWFGWQIGSKMPATYIRKAGINLEEPLLKMHGIEIKSDKGESSLMIPKKCFYCEHNNAATNNVCSKCGKPLNSEEIKRLEAEKEEELATMKAYIQEKKKKEVLSDEAKIKRIVEETMRKLREESK